MAGRDFEPRDADTTTFNIVIDDVLATRFFSDGSALGAQAFFFGDTATVVGVVDQARLYDVHADDRGQVYLAFQRFPTTSMSYVARTSVDPIGLTPSARAMLAELDASLPMAGVRTLEEIVDASLGQQRLSLTLVVAFALGALLLTTLGIYGVVSNAVVRRTREIGLRMALGADPSSVVGDVLRQGVVLAVAGALIGLVGAVAMSRTLSSVVVGVDPTDPVVYAAVALGLVAIAAIASYLPARRATRIDPLAALTPD
jgi:ABC-type antimicrobial peptide transport system permease subunit